MLYDIVEGTTTPLQFQLVENGVAINLTGITVALLIEDRLGNVVPNPGTITVVSASTGTIQFLPTSSFTLTHLHSPYYARWVLTTTLGLVGYVPSNFRDVWSVISQ